MAFSRMLFVGFCITLRIFVEPPALAQGSDAQGSRVLEQAIEAAGGRQAWEALKNFRASGAFSIYSGGDLSDTGEVTLLGSGIKRFRLTATLKHESRTWLWKDGRGFLSTDSGLGGPIGRHNLSVLEGITLPAQRLFYLLDWPSRSVQLIESAAIDGRQAYRVRLVTTASNRAEAVSMGRSSLVTDFLIDCQTLAIIAIEDTIHPNDHTRDVFSHRVTYGDYRPVAGVQVPFAVREEISRQLTWGLQLEAFEPHDSFAETEFELR